MSMGFVTALLSGTLIQNIFQTVRSVKHACKVSQHFFIGVERHMDSSLNYYKHPEDWTVLEMSCLNDGQHMSCQEIENEFGE